MSSQLGQKYPGRNDPCPCGSGKKYKKCCGAFADDTNTNSAQSPSLKSGFDLYGKGDFVNAKNIAESLAKSDPLLTEAFALKGMCNYELGNLNEAREDFSYVDLHSEYLRNKDDIPKIKLSLSTIENELGNSIQAEKYAREAIDMGLKTGATFSALAIALATQGKYLDSISPFEESLRIDPHVAQVWANKGNAHLFLLEISLAKNCFLRALELDADSAMAHSGMGAIYVRQAEFAKAFTHFAKVLSFGAIDDDLTYNLGIVLWQLGNNKESKKWLQKSIELNKYKTESHLMLAQILLDEGNQSEVDKVVQSLLSIGSNDEKVLFSLADFMEQSNKIEEARKFIDALNDLQLDQDNQWLIRGKILLAHLQAREKKFEEAVKNLSDVGDRANNHLDLYMRWNYEMGYVLDKSGEYEAAYNAYENANNAKKELWDVNFSMEGTRKLHGIIRNTFSNDLLQEFRSIEIDKTELPLPIFIVGFPRSGTTLLEQMMGQHPSIVAAGELEGVKMAQYKIGEIINTDIGYPDILGSFKLAANKSAIEKLRMAYYDYVNQRVNLDRNAKWFVDKLPANLINLGFISCVFPESPIIHIRRHPLSSCLSVFMTEFSQRHEYSLNITDTAMVYLEQMKLVDFYKKNLDMNYLEIRYEDLVRDTEKTLREIFDFVGERFDPESLNFHKSERIARTASYEQVSRRVYTDSLQRHVNYSNKLKEASGILAPIIEEYYL